jgi:hypothetical protein
MHPISPVVAGSDYIHLFFSCQDFCTVSINVPYLLRCKDENLKAPCQRCHNSYDAKERARGIRLRKRAAMNIEPLF